MTVSDISTIRINVWRDMDTDSVGGKNLTRGAGATNNGPGADLGLVTTGAANSYAQAVGYRPAWASQGTLIFRAYFPSGCSGGSSPWFAGDNGGNPLCGFQGIYFIVNQRFCTARPNANPGAFETVAGTWGPDGLKGYTNGTLIGTYAYTDPPTQSPTYDMTFGCLLYGGGYVQNVAMTMDFAAYLNRQLSDAEVLDLTTTPSQLWAAAAAAGGDKRSCKFGAKRSGFSCGGL